MSCKYCKADCAHRGENRQKECRGYTPMSGGDLVRSMNNTELAIMFAKLGAKLKRLDRPVKHFSGRAVNENYRWLEKIAKKAIEAAPAEMDGRK